ncbi:MAG TPA: MFS transporter [Verrucomicrobiae bacterium]|nr:MFS transporter [Verrucomicrobiae bacterium]
MEAVAHSELSASPSSAGPATPARGMRKIYFVLEAINATATAYYFNYLFFYMRDHFGFGNRNNLMLTATHGCIYTITAWNAGRFALRHGYHFSLRLGFCGMVIALSTGAMVPRMFGYSRAGLVGEVCCLVLWTVSMCLTWPTLQALLSLGQAPTEMPHAAGMYNVVWATGAAFANLTGGALYQHFGGETLFWLPAAMHVAQLALMLRLSGAAPGLAPANTSASAASPVETIPPLNPRPIAKARTFLYLAWLANPFAYMAINGVLPVMPKLAANLGLDAAQAGLAGSVWFWARLGAFVWFYLWSGWHYRFRWLLAAFIALACSFTLTLLSPNVWILVAAELVFGLAVGLIYYSSLFYSMDVGESTSKRGGFHEAAIGLGVCTGPAIGVIALYILPEVPNAGIWAISTALLLGLVPFTIIKKRGA